MANQKVADAPRFRISEFNRRDSISAAAAPGFRHFLGTPTPLQRFRAFGIDPLVSPSDHAALRGLMHRLSRRMDAIIKWPPHQTRTEEQWENPLIPSGYTYLLQFVAHDLVHSAIPLSVAGGLGRGTSNARRLPLRLETPSYGVCVHCQLRSELPADLARQLAAGAHAVREQAVAERQMAATIAALPDRERALRARLGGAVVALVACAALAAAWGWLRRATDSSWHGFLAFAVVAATVP